MKKIILILFLFLSCYLCYFIYNVTEDNKQYILGIGDNVADNQYLEKDNKYIYNNNFINQDYRIIDILNIIKYNQEITINNKEVSIHRLLKKSDIIIISIGMNDIYYKLNDDTKEIYTYLNNIISNYEKIKKEINRYSPKQVIILGYYNIYSKNNDLFNYINYKLEKLADKHNCTYIELNKIMHNNQKYLKKSTKFYPNNEGYNQIHKLIVEKLKKS